MKKNKLAILERDTEQVMIEEQSGNSNKEETKGKKYFVDSKIRVYYPPN